MSSERSTLVVENFSRTRELVNTGVGNLLTYIGK